MRYITFIRDNEKNTEFVSCKQGTNHHDILIYEEKRYPEPRYTVHTCYSEQELENILENLRRWSAAS